MSRDASGGGSTSNPINDSGHNDTNGGYGDAINNNNNNGIDTHYDALSERILPNPSSSAAAVVVSPSKKAVRIMNLTNGLCADPFHYHSFAAISSSSWIDSPSSSLSSFLTTPKCLFVGTFSKCAACHARLGGDASSTTITTTAPARTTSSSTADNAPASSVTNTRTTAACGSSSFSGMSMLQCVACGMYAHRSCAFARPPSPTTNTCATAAAKDNASGVRNMPLCQVNFAVVQRALNDGSSNETHESPFTPPPPLPSSLPSPPSATLTTETASTSHYPWSFFGNRSQTTGAVAAAQLNKDDNDDNHDEIKQSTLKEEDENDLHNAIDTATTTDSTTSTIEPSSKSNNESGTTTMQQSKEITTTTDEADILKKSVESHSPQQQQQLQQQQQPQPGIFQTLQTSAEIIRQTSQTTKNIPKASAVGMVAGSVAGLAIAGPAGVVMGAQIGRTVLATGVAVQGFMSTGVLVMSLAAAAKYSFVSISSAKDERELKLPGQEESSTLVLVRPDIAVDPIWGVYANEARELWEKRILLQSSWGSGLGHFFVSSAESSSIANLPERDARYRHDSDIIRANSSELSMREKVFLLVNRILNDETSLPGYMYRHLVRKHIVHVGVNEESVEMTVPVKSQPDDDDDVLAAAKSPSRTCRQDAHGIIKHVTATLLEVRTGLASSPTITEMSATAVEILVFGELYDDVFLEIKQQTKEQDENLLMKVEKLCCESGESKATQDAGAEISVSQSAIAALGLLPEAHTPADKLVRCVEFLECVSAHFSSIFKGKDGSCGENDMHRCIDADTLLKMVCQHIVAARVKHLHAEVVFIEEFSRDEQFFRGKEGYALITLQASLHYLDSLDVLDSDMYPIYRLNGEADDTAP